MYKCMNYFKQYNDNLIKDKENSEVLPNIEFLDYMPDDFVKAPAPDLIFHYAITTPDGEYLWDQSYLTPTVDFIGYSIEDDGEYYWTYSTKSIVPNFGEIKDWHASDWNQPWEMPFYDGEYYLPIVHEYLLPQTYLGKWKFTIESIERNLINNDIDFIFRVDNNYPKHNIIVNPKTGERTIINKPSPYFTLFESDSIIVDGETIEEKPYFLDPEMFYDADDITGDLAFKPNKDNYGEFEYTLSHEKVGEKINIEFISKYSEGVQDWRRYGESSYEDEVYGEYDWYEPDDKDYLIINEADQITKVEIDPSVNTTYNINFINDNSKQIKVPYAMYMGSPSKSEVFTFTKLFENSYEYPTTTTDLLRLDYTDGANTSIAHMDDGINATYSINNVRGNVLPIKKRKEGNSIIFYVDEAMYYDKDNEAVILGEAANDENDYINEKGIVLPWDEPSSGTIEFTVNLNTYQDYTFNFELKIGSKNPLRGKDGKYEVKEIYD